jgi:hypothetical protein
MSGDNSLSDVDSLFKNENKKKIVKDSAQIGKVKVSITALRVGYKDNDGSNKYRHYLKPEDSDEVSLRRARALFLSNGLFQFEDIETRKINPTSMSYDGTNDLPYVFIIDIDAGSVDAASNEYPFTNSRESLRDGDVKKYVDKFMTELASKELNDEYDSEFKPMTGLDGGPASPFAPVMYNNTTTEIAPPEQEFMNQMSTLIFEEADNMVYLLRGAQTEGLLEDSWDRVLLNGEQYRESEPYVINYHYGAALSKNWGGVNGLKAPTFMLVNPVYHKNTSKFMESADGKKMFASYLSHIIIHELNHTFQRSEGAGFTWSLANVESFLSSDGYTDGLKGRILELVNSHGDAIVSLHEKFTKSTVRESDSEFTGGGYITSGSQEGGGAGNQGEGRGGQGNGPNAIADSELQGRSPTSTSSGGASQDRVGNGAGRQGGGNEQAGNGIRFGDAIIHGMAQSGIAPLYQENQPQDKRGSYQNIEDGARGLIKIFQGAVEVEPMPVLIPPFMGHISRARAFWRLCWSGDCLRSPPAQISGHLP